MGQMFQRPFPQLSQFPLLIPFTSPDSFGAINMPVEASFHPFFQMNVSSSFQVNPFEPGILTSLMASSYIRLSLPQWGFPPNQANLEFSFMNSWSNNFMSSFSFDESSFGSFPEFPSSPGSRTPEEIAFDGITAEEIWTDNARFAIELTEKEQTQHKGTKLQVCPICLSEYLPRNSMNFPCPAGHIFHARCLLRWAQEKQPIICPLCRVSMPRNQS